MLRDGLVDMLGSVSASDVRNIVDYLCTSWPMLLRCAQMRWQGLVFWLGRLASRDVAHLLRGLVVWGCRSGRCLCVSCCFYCAYIITVNYTIIIFLSSLLLFCTAYTSLIINQWTNCLLVLKVLLNPNQTNRLHWNGVLCSRWSIVQFTSLRTAV